MCFLFRYTLFFLITVDVDAVIEDVVFLLLPQPIRDMVSLGSPEPTRGFLLIVIVWTNITLTIGDAANASWWSKRNMDL